MVLNVSKCETAFSNYPCQHPTIYLCQTLGSIQTEGLVVTTHCCCHVMYCGRGLFPLMCELGALKTNEFAKGLFGLLEEIAEVNHGV